MAGPSLGPHCHIQPVIARRGTGRERQIAKHLPRPGFRRDAANGKVFQRSSPVGLAPILAHQTGRNRAGRVLGHAQRNAGRFRFPQHAGRFEHAARQFGATGGNGRRCVSRAGNIRPKRSQDGQQRRLASVDGFARGADVTQFDAVQPRQVAKGIREHFGGRSIRHEKSFLQHEFNAGARLESSSILATLSRATRHPVEPRVKDVRTRVCTPCSLRTACLSSLHDFSNRTPRNRRRAERNHRMDPPPRHPPGRPFRPSRQRTRLEFFLRYPRNRSYRPV